MDKAGFVNRIQLRKYALPVSPAVHAGSPGRRHAPDPGPLIAGSHGISAQIDTGHVMDAPSGRNLASSTAVARPGRFP